jgi:hypothetical protein
VSGTPLGQPDVGTTTRTGRNRSVWPALAFLALLCVAGALVVAVVFRPGTALPHKIYEYTVPSGTVARIEAGEKLYVFPRQLDVRVGDQLVIHNNDTRVIEVGPYTVDRNATLAQTFNQPGTIVGICTIHPSGRVTINVRT